MKRFNLIIGVLGIFLFLNSSSCSKQEIIKSSSKHSTISKISLIPQAITPNEEVFIIDTICTYELLKTLTIENFNIWYIRSLNSEMMWPCMFKIDSLSLGKLPKGSYTLYYYLIDKSRFVADSISRTDVIHFDVK